MYLRGRLFCLMPNSFCATTIKCLSKISHDVKNRDKNRYRKTDSMLTVRRPSLGNALLTRWKEAGYILAYIFNFI